MRQRIETLERVADGLVPPRSMGEGLERLGYVNPANQGYNVDLQAFIFRAELDEREIEVLVPLAYNVLVVLRGALK